MIKNSYVVSITKKCNNKNEEVFLSSAGNYPRWDNKLQYAIKFTTSEAAKERFFEDKESLFMYDDSDAYILSSLCVKQIKLEPILYL